MEAFIIFLLILVNGLFSMSEIAMISSRKSKLNSEAAKGDKAAKAALKLSSDPDKFLSAVQMGVTLVGILTGIFSGDTLARDFAEVFVGWGLNPGTAGVIAKAIIVFIVMFLSILIGELVPKRIAMSNPEKVAKALSGLMRFVSWIASPIVWALAKSTAICTKILRIKECESKVTEDEIKSMIEEGKDEGEVLPVEQDIVERVFTLGDLSVSTIMTLRDDIVWLDLEMTEAETIKIIESTIFEQYPVVEGDLDHVAGVLSIKDYLAALRSGGEFNLKKMVKEPHYVHENMSVYAVLEYMKSERIHRALVCDEFGGLAGIISLKDIFDALVGNMNAQEQMKEPDIIARKDGDGWYVDGQCSMYDFLTHFGLDENIEDYDFSTVGGLLLEKLEHVPKSGEGIEWEGFSFEVADMDGARIDKVIVKKLPVPEEQEAE
ncbi:MAG: hemolysin family protein [Candidatus Cryptobacteroides sp.]|nr:hemolysin family protein [Bacteroidales bacterium]